MQQKVQAELIPVGAAGYSGAGSYSTGFLNAAPAMGTQVVSTSYAGGAATTGYASGAFGTQVISPGYAGAASMGAPLGNATAVVTPYTGGSMGAYGAPVYTQAF